MFEATLFLLFKYDFNKIQQIATNLKKSYQKTNMLDEVIADKVIKKIQKKLKIESKEETLILITGVLQKGGSNKIATNNITFKHENITLSSGELQNTISQIKKNATIRQFARSIANDIAKTALLLGIEGDLSNQMRYEYPNLSKNEAV